MNHSDLIVNWFNRFIEPIQILSVCDYWMKPIQIQTDSLINNWNGFVNWINWMNQILPSLIVLEFGVSKMLQLAVWGKKDVPSDSISLPVSLKLFQRSLARERKISYKSERNRKQITVLIIIQKKAEESLAYMLGLLQLSLLKVLNCSLLGVSEGNSSKYLFVFVFLLQKRLKMAQGEPALCSLAFIHVNTA